MKDNLESLNNDGGHTVKIDLDYRDMCDEKIAVAESLGASGKLQEALDTLLVVEKTTRNASDVVSTGRILVAIVKLCFHAKDWALLNEYIFMLAKKKSQLILAFGEMVRECYTFIDQMPDKETKYKLIECLRIVTEGKVELDRDQLTLKLIQIKESEGDVTGAENILQELQFEAYGCFKTQEEI
ncbi:hypothetical protein QTP88_011561 [Uroleucon formosanum]